MELMEECPEWKPLEHFAADQLSTDVLGLEADDEPELSESDEEVSIQ